MLVKLPFMLILSRLLGFTVSRSFHIANFSTSDENLNIRLKLQTVNVGNSTNDVSMLDNDVMVRYQNQDSQKL